MDHRCPDCGAALQTASTPGGRVLSCPTCRGHLYGLSPFERMLADGVGARVWTASETGASGPACPYCGAAMHGAAGVGADLSVCRTDQVVWVPDGAADWVAAHRPATGAPEPAVATLPAQCANCGAPYQPDEEGRCHWCHAQIAAPQPLVMVMESEAPPEPTWGLRLI